MVRLNHAVAVGMATGPLAGLDLLAGPEQDGRLGGDHRLQAVRAHLLEMVATGLRKNRPISTRPGGRCSALSSATCTYGRLLARDQ